MKHTTSILHGLFGAVVMIAVLNTAPVFAAEQERSVLYYRNPMNPAITSPVPAKDSMGMDYIPVYADAAADAQGAVVRIDPAVVQNLGVRTGPVTRGRLWRRIDTVGNIGYDEQRVTHVHMRAEGWIEHLRVNFVGARVEQGEVLFEIYSPSLANAQEELLQALRVGQADLIGASRERLRLLGVDAGQIRALESSRKVASRIAVRAPQTGVVTEMNVRDGMYVTPDTIVMSLADLSSVWLLADVFERQAAWVAVGQTAEVRLPYRPGEVFAGEVDFVYPSLDPKTRSLRARLRFDNPGEVLKPGMYANVQIFAEPKDGVLSVPQQALIRSGRTDRVILALGEGRFRAVNVIAGMESGDWIEIREGLQEGDQVVVSGQFLIDSEASIKASALRMQSAAATDAKTEAVQPAQTVSGEGTVTAVMADHRMLTIEHAPIEVLGWPAMTMDFNVAEGVDLSGIKVGERIHFILEQGEGEAYEIGGIHEME